jgi:hypothetical protein
MSAVTFDASSALPGTARYGSPTREGANRIARGRLAGSSRLPHRLSPAGRCQFRSGIVLRTWMFGPMRPVIRPPSGWQTVDKVRPHSSLMCRRFCIC